MAQNGWNRAEALYAENERLKGEVAELKEKTKAPPKASPRGTIDKKGVLTSGGVGVAGAPVGAFSEDISGWVFQVLNAGSDRLMYEFFHLPSIEMLIKGVVGFCVAGTAAAIYKITKSYK